MNAADAILTSDGTPLAPAQALEALRGHAIRCYPEECVGIIDNHGIYHPIRNVSAKPKDAALIAPHTLAALMEAGSLRALCHSHPGGPDCPSQQDMEAQAEMEAPFIIVSTDGSACARPFAWGDQIEDSRPLVGRPFRHGVDDCYALIRNWYRTERGIVLPDFPRGWEWWRDDVAGAHGLERDLYRRFFADAGFVEVDRIGAQPGDVWLAAVRSDIPNHAGVYLGGGLTIHHSSSGLAYDAGRLSKRDSLARWTPLLTHWLRRP